MAFYATVPVPLVVFPDLAPTGYYMAASGQTVVFPFALPAAGVITINVIQQIGTQDFTLRAWVSFEPNGISASAISNIEFWHPNHTPNTIVAAYDLSGPPPLATRLLPLLPGNYFLNVQNLENRNNVFYSLLTLL